MEHFVRECEACTTAANPRNAPLVPVPLPPAPWYKLGLDFIGPMEGGGVQRRFALVAVDYYSKWPEVAFCSSPTSDVVADFLETVARREGYPVEIVTDNGAAFCSQQMKQYFKQAGIGHVRVAPYQPRGAGAVERMNRVIKGVLQTATADGVDWLRAVRQFLLSYRTTTHATTGRSPAELLRGRQLRTRLHAAVQVRPPEDDGVRRTVERKQQTQKRNFDKSYRVKKPQFEVGDWVRYRLVPRPRKGRPRFSNPCQIVGQRGPLSFELSNGSLVHAERLTGVLPVSPESVSKPQQIPVSSGPGSSGLEGDVERERSADSPARGARGAESPTAEAPGRASPAREAPGRASPARKASDRASPARGAQSAGSPSAGTPDRTSPVQVAPGEGSSEPTSPERAESPERAVPRAPRGRGVPRAPRGRAVLRGAQRGNSVAGSSGGDVLTRAGRVSRRGERFGD